jgi:phosphoenolpyruvate synthase/pyruvate phosphate dikinase
MIEPFISEGDQVENVLLQLNTRLNLFADSTLSVSRELQGVAAYYDPAEPTITGIVTVIKDPKHETLKKDDILVAPSTTPDYVDAIRKCKAIITDWGGQTSHAAIISRELKKPCLIGTNYASQVLHNGDTIRIDLKRGIVELVRGA